MFVCSFALLREKEETKEERNKEKRKKKREKKGVDSLCRYGGYWCPVEERKLTKFKYADSKQLKEEVRRRKSKKKKKILTYKEQERDRLFEKVKASGHGCEISFFFIFLFYFIFVFSWKVVVLQASELSGKMLRTEKYNLNLISHDAAAQIIQVWVILFLFFFFNFFSATVCD